MEVDLWTDVVCPWCYIGVSRFERALARADAHVTLRIHPFQLDPDAPIPGVPAIERYRRKFGEQASEIIARVTEAAHADGLDFNLDRAISANTFDSHRALQFAQDVGRGRELEMSLYRAYFVEGLDISDPSVIADRGAAVGLDRDALRVYLAGSEGVETVAQELAGAVERGITGVPAFVFNGEFMVPGAVDEDTFVRILGQMKALTTERE